MQALDRRIENFMIKTLNTSKTLARQKRREYYNRYGISIKGLIKDYGVNFQHYCDYIFAVKLPYYLKPDSKMINTFRKIKLKKYIFSNAVEKYIRQGLEILGLLPFFTRIYDIQFTGLRPKPSPAAYRKVLSHIGMPPQNMLFIDDEPKNIASAKRLGLRTALVCTSSQISDADYTLRHLDELPEILKKAN